MRRSRPIGDDVEAVTLGDRGANAHEQNLVQLLRDAFRAPRASLMNLQGIVTSGKKRLSHRPADVEPCAIGMEACGSAHYWARQFRAMGHEVKLTPPIYVKAYVKRGKNDAADAAAICEAMSSA